MCLRHFFRKNLREDVGEGFLSLLLDESTDIAVLKQLGFCIRYFSIKQRRIVDTFLGLVRLDSGDAPGIAGVKKTLKAFNLPSSKLRSIGTDNASVVTGVYFRRILFMP